MSLSKNIKIAIGVTTGLTVVATALFAKPLMVNHVSKNLGLDKAELKNKSFKELWKLNKSGNEVANTDLAADGRKAQKYVNNYIWKGKPLGR